MTYTKANPKTKRAAGDTNQLGLKFDASLADQVYEDVEQWSSDNNNNSGNSDGKNEGTVECVDSTPPATNARKRAARAARTSVLLSRLQGLGLQGITTLKLMRTRRVMASISGNTLRVHEGFASAPDDTLGALVIFATSRNNVARKRARDVILAFEVDCPPPLRRVERPMPGDLALVNVLDAEHRELNSKWFDGALKHIAIRLSGRMASRLGHYDPGSSTTPSEIALSRAHVLEHGWREASHTLLHEMVHQWQHETGRSVNHGPDFRKKCREVGITPAARRDLLPIKRRRRRRA